MIEVAARQDGDLQTAMSALESAISMLGTVTTASHGADATAAVGREQQLDWPVAMGGEEAGESNSGGYRWWRARVPQSSGPGLGSASAHLSNTLSLLDSTIVAIDNAMTPPPLPPPSSLLNTGSSSYSRHQPNRRPADVATHFRRSDVVDLTSGFHPTVTCQPQTRISRFDSGTTAGGGSSSYRSPAWSSRTQLETLLQPIDSVQLGIRQPPPPPSGIVFTLVCLSVCLSLDIHPTVL